MSCEPGQHDFRPYPRSRDLYCRFCGEPRAFAREAAAPREEQRAETEALRRIEQLVAGDAPAAGTQQILPGIDPDAAAAHDIVEQRRTARFEAAVDAVLLEAQLDPATAAELRREALEFGPSLDLNDFRRIAMEAGRPDRVPAHSGVEAT